MIEFLFCINTWPRSYGFYHFFLIRGKYWFKKNSPVLVSRSKLDFALLRENEEVLIFVVQLA